MRSSQCFSTFFSHGGVMAFLAFFLWGILPIYWKNLQNVSALEIFCHRVIWSFFFIGIFLLCTGNMGKVLAICRDKKSLFFLALSSLTLSSNWLLYIWAIVSGRIIESSLGYYINPLLNIFVGICVFRERSSKLIWFAIFLASLSVFYQIIIIGEVPWLGLAIGGTFCVYGVLRKLIVVEALPGIFVETAFALPFTLGYVIWLSIKGTGAIGTVDLSTNALLVASGIVTTLPLMGFTFGARRINFTTLGILQYISPSLMFLIGVFLYHEPIEKEQIAMFACIWLALALYSYDNFCYYKKHVST